MVEICALLRKSVEDRKFIKKFVKKLIRTLHAHYETVVQKPSIIAQTCKTIAYNIMSQLFRTHA